MLGYWRDFNNRGWLCTFSMAELSLEQRGNQMLPRAASTGKDDMVPQVPTWEDATLSVWCYIECLMMVYWNDVFTNLLNYMTVWISVCIISFIVCIVCECWCKHNVLCSSWQINWSKRTTFTRRGYPANYSTTEREQMESSSWSI